MMAFKNNINSFVVFDIKRHESTATSFVRRMFTRGPVSLKETRKGCLDGTRQFL
jgi:hypothetical protein